MTSPNPNLSKFQFMSVKELGGYQSQDYPDKTMDQVHQMIGRRRYKNDDYNYKQGVLKRSIQEEGIRDPVTVDPVNKIYGQGHHRFHAARRLRMKEVPVQYKDMGG